MDSNSGLNFWEWTEYGAEVVVFLGALGETIVEFTKWIRPRSLSKKVARVSALALVAGLVVETLTTANVNGIANKQVADLTLRSEEASRGAANATLLAARLGVKVDTLPSFVSKKEDELNTLADRMKKGSAALDKARTDAQASESKAEDALKAFRAEAGARSLTSEQRSKLIAAIKGKITMKIKVESVTGDVESYPYAMQLLSAMKEAGIKAEYQPFPTPFFWFNDPGVFVWHGGPTGKASGAILLQALKSAGIEATDSESDAVGPQEPTWLDLVIWAKKPPAPVPN